MYNHELKLERAFYHLQNLEGEIASWLEKQPYRFVHDLDLKSAEKQLIIELLEPVPPVFATTVGDCLHNLSSALDNLVYELAVAYKGEPLSKSIERDIAFPILRTDDEESAKKFRRMVRDIHPDAQTIIKKLQPYERGSDATRYVISNLNELSNKDKHRFPHLGVLSVGSITIYIPPEIRFIKRPPLMDPIEDRTVIMSYLASPGVHPEVNMQHPPTFFIAFGKGSPDAIYGYQAVAVLREIHNYIVNKVVPFLAPYLS